MTLNDSTPIQIFFCKPPVIGRVKTRLVPFLGDRGAWEVYHKLLADTLLRFQGTPYVIYSAEPESAGLFREIARRDVRVETQEGADLGARMAHALFAEALSSGRDVLLTGVDIPGYTPQTARVAAEILKTQDVVLGPAADGGYYLIGFSHEAFRRFPRAVDLQALFADIAWSTPTVLDEQLIRLKRAELSIGFAPTLHDVDTPADFLHTRKESDLPFPDVRAVLPVLNERETLALVLSDLKAAGIFEEIICADNGSTDGSVEIAAAAGVRITSCLERGYGAACLTALEDIRSRGGCDIVLFLDADGSDDPGAFLDLLSPILSGESDLVLGVRREAPGEEGAVPAHARFGNLLACFLIRLLYGHAYHDLGPFRAVRWRALEEMRMDDRNFGWTVQMQVRALQTGARVRETNVRARRRRGGKSKVSTTIKGSFRAGWVIISTIFRELRKEHGPGKRQAEDRG